VLLDQTRLPEAEIYLRCEATTELIEAIQRLSVRGAPAIGVAGAYGCALAARLCQEKEAAAFRAALEPELLRMREHMIRRGPDGAGLWISDDRRVGLAHRRLAIIDLSDEAAQPMWNAERTLCITYNGEIYNYRALRKELAAEGYVFRSQSDTEVLLQMYAAYGAEMLDRLRGMYAFAIWDARAQALFLARDPFGIKPLYYADDGATLRFASQVKALVAGGGVDTAPEPAGSVGFLLWGYVPEPFTIHRGIAALPAGSHLTLQRGDEAKLVSYFDVRDELSRAQVQARAFRSRTMTTTSTRTSTR